MSIGVTMTGGAEVRAALEHAHDALAHPDDVNDAAAAEVLRLAGPATPRATGRLAASGRVNATDAGATISWAVPYAVFVNFGTEVMRARPFATDALAAAEPAITRLWADYLDTAI